MVYEKALNVGSGSGVTEGSGSTASAGISLAPAIVILATPALVTSLIIFIFRRRLSVRISDTPVVPGLSATGPVSTSPVKEERDESPKKEEREATDEEILRAMLESTKTESETTT